MARSVLLTLACLGGLVTLGHARRPEAPGPEEALARSLAWSARWVREEREGAARSPSPIDPELVRERLRLALVQAAGDGPLVARVLDTVPFAEDASPRQIAGRLMARARALPLRAGQRFRDLVRARLRAPSDGAALGRSLGEYLSAEGVPLEPEVREPEAEATEQREAARIDEEPPYRVTTRLDMKRVAASILEGLEAFR